MSWEGRIIHFMTGNFGIKERQEMKFLRNSHLMPMQYPENLYKYPSKVFQIIWTPNGNDIGDDNDNCNSNNNYHQLLTLISTATIYQT